MGIRKGQERLMTGSTETRVPTFTIFVSVKNWRVFSRVTMVTLRKDIEFRRDQRSL